MVIDAASHTARARGFRVSRAPVRPAREGTRRRWRVPMWVSMACPALLIVYWFLLRSLGDRWWPATVLLLAPRWPLALPLLCVAALVIRNRCWNGLPPLAAAAVVLLFPILGVRLSP